MLMLQGIKKLCDFIRDAGVLDEFKMYSDGKNGNYIEFRKQ